MSGGERRWSFSSSRSKITDEESLMECDDQKEISIGNRKRKNEGKVTDSDDADSIKGELVVDYSKAKKRAAKEKGKQTDGTKAGVKTLRKKAEAKQDTDAQESNDQEGEVGQRAGDNTEGNSEAGELVARKIVSEVKRILDSISREHNGKIAVTRKEQSEVRGAEANILTKGTEMLARQMEVERKVNEREKKIEKLREEVRRVRVEKGNRTRRREASRGEDSTTEKSSQEDGANSRRRGQRTYAQVSKGMNASVSERNGREARIEGRVVVVGREGWKTPQPTTRERENKLVIESTGGRGAREIQTTAKGTGLEKLAGKEDPVELDSSLAL